MIYPAFRIIRGLSFPRKSRVPTIGGIQAGGLHSSIPGSVVFFNSEIGDLLHATIPPPYASSICFLLIYRNIRGCAYTEIISVPHSEVLEGS